MVPGLELWYIIISLALGFGIPIVPAILGHSGADPIYGGWYVPSAVRKLTFSYFVSDNMDTRVLRFGLDIVRPNPPTKLTSQYMWQCLASLISAGSIIAVSPIPLPSHLVSVRLC